MKKISFTAEIQIHKHDNVCNPYQGNSIPRVTKCDDRPHSCGKKDNSYKLEEMSNYVP